MTQVKELIKEAMRLIGRFDAADNYGTVDETDEHGAIAKSLLYCFNAVADELTRHYFPVTAVESVSDTDGKLYFSSLNNPLLKVYSLTDSRGYKVKFEQFPDRMEFLGSDLTLKYAALHSPCEENDDCDLDKRMGEKLITYGMVAEYCLIIGECSLAEQWENRYRRELDRSLADLPNGGYLPPRRWV